MRNTKQEILDMDGPLPKDLCLWWKEFLTEERTLDDLFNSPVFPLQRKRETVRMLEIANSIQPKTVMEIGADKGGGIWAWLKYVPTIQHIIISEVRGTPYSSMLFEKFHKETTCIDSSYDPLNVRQVYGYLKNRMIDVLFIDGDKANFLRDLDSYLPMMNPNGIVFMHDITDTSPGVAYSKAIERGYRHEEVVIYDDAYEAMERERQGVPATSAYEGWLRHWKGSSCGVGVLYLGSN